jgi:hypothetical protein
LPFGPGGRHAALSRALVAVRRGLVITGRSRAPYEDLVGLAGRGDRRAGRSTRSSQLLSHCAPRDNPSNLLAFSTPSLPAGQRTACRAWRDR